MTCEIMYVMGSIDRGDVRLAYDRAVAHDVEDVAEMIITFAEYIGRLEKQRDELLAALKGLHDVCEIALSGKDGLQYAYLETRAGHFVAAVDAMKSAESAISSVKGGAA